MTRKQARNAVRRRRGIADAGRYRVRARRAQGRCIIEAEALRRGHAYARIVLASARTWADAARQAGVLHEPGAPA